MNNIMVDVESLGIHPGSVLLSIGAVRFSMGLGRSLGEEFYVNIDVGSSLRFGLKIESSTFYWWMRQGDNARWSLSNPKPLQLLDALAAFREFVVPDESPMLWAKPPGFDLGLLQELYRNTDQPRPWGFRNERDVRTFCDAAARMKWEYPKIKSSIKHNALADAKAQVWVIHSADAYMEKVCPISPRSVVKQLTEMVEPLPPENSTIS